MNQLEQDINKAYRDAFERLNLHLLFGTDDLEQIRNMKERGMIIEGIEDYITLPERVKSIIFPDPDRNREGQNAKPDDGI